MEHLIELKDVYKIYHMGDEDVHALDGVSLTIDKGEFVAIVGQSGSGKSTAMNIIGCLDVPTSGTYHLGGVDVSTMDDDQQAEIRNKMLGFIFQQYNLIPKLTVLENVELPLIYQGIDPIDRRELAMQAQVNPNTMQRALTELEREGLLIGGGTSGRTVTKEEKVLEAMRQQALEDLARECVEKFKVFGITPAQAAEIMLHVKEEEK